MKTNKLFSKVSKIIRYLVFRIFHEGFTHRAASLAYESILGIVPLVIITFNILSIFPKFKGTEQILQNFIVSHFVAESAAQISTILSQFITHIHRLSGINVIFLAIINLLMLYSIQDAFNSVWHAKSRFHISISFLFYAVVLFVAPFFFGGVLILGSLLYRNADIATSFKQSWIISLFYFLLPHIITFITFSFFNWILPSTRVKFRYALLGGLITAIIFDCAKALFTVYFTHVRTYTLIYGALSALPLFALWLYFSWLIVLFGALITNLVAVGIPPKWEKFLHDRSR